MNLTFDDFWDFIDDRLDDVDRNELFCPVCGKEEWLYSGEDRSKASIPIGPIEDGSPTIYAQLPVVWIRCAHCGHILFFSVKAIQTWKRRKERASKKRQAESP